MNSTLPPHYKSEAERSTSTHADNAAVSAINSTLPPLVVDLDGTLTPTDTLVESVILVLKHKPLNVFKLPFWLVKGRAEFKALVASHCKLAAEHLPYRPELISYLQSEKEKGRRLILATAAHRDIADAVATHLNLFDTVLASDGTSNLKSTNKLASIKENVGDKFVYAGDCAADLPIWKESEAAILVGVPPNIAKTVRASTPIEREFPHEKIQISTWMRALRVHQWLKNLLLFVPLLTTFAFFEIDKLAHILVAFLAFSLAASATYIMNDLLDLESDRAHPRKCRRPFASAHLPIMQGIFVGISALSIALILAASVSQGFFLMLMLYLVLTISYSLVLKQYVLLDVLMLSILYALRILAGSIAVGISTSSWLFAFSLFIFFSLALVKRCSELVSLEQIGRSATRGRDYRVADLAVLWPLGVGSALCAVVVFGLFISAPETQNRYASPQILWLVATLLIYWISRLWIKTVRGEMHDDPIIYAIKNFGSCVTIFAMVGVTLAAHFLKVG